MATSLDEITGGVPRAPHPPDIEDVLGPPPHPPRIGRHGSLGSHGGPIGSRRRNRPPSPPHLAKPSPPPQQAPQRQTIIQEIKPQPYKPPVATPANTPPDEQQQPAPRGMGRPGYRARKEAREQHAREAREQSQAWQQRSGNAAPDDELSQRAEAAREAMRRRAAEQQAHNPGANDTQADEEAQRFANDPTYQAHNPTDGEATP